MLVRQADLAVRHSLSLSPSYILRNRTALLLCQTGHDGDQQLAFGIQRVDVFFFKKHLHAFFFQLSHSRQRIYSVSCKPADRLGDNQIDLAVQSICHHAIKAVPMFGIQGRNALIGIDCNKLPVCPFLNVLGVAIYLCSIRGLLLLRIRGNSGIGCHSAFLNLGFRQMCYGVKLCRYF